jgi:tRNA(fMet)-specific endonuclease VapC
VSRLLLDTTFLVAADRAGGALDEVIEDNDDVAIAAVTLAELLVGVELGAGRHRARRQAFVEEISAGIPVLNYDIAVAELHAQLLVATKRAGKPRGAHDLIIAATARASQREVVSADASAFRGLPGVAVRSN